jgi:hypothetical protein
LLIEALAVFYDVCCGFFEEFNQGLVLRINLDDCGDKRGMKKVLDRHIETKDAITRFGKMLAFSFVFVLQFFMIM